MDTDWKLLNKAKRLAQAEPNAEGGSGVDKAERAVRAEGFGHTQRRGGAEGVWAQGEGGRAEFGQTQSGGGGEGLGIYM